MSIIRYDTSDEYRNYREYKLVPYIFDIFQYVEAMSVDEREGLFGWQNSHQVKVKRLNFYPLKSRQVKFLLVKI